MIRPPRWTCSTFASGSGVARLFRVVIFLAIAGLVRLEGRELKFHGPILQWHRDPLTSVTITWVEDLAPGPIPVWSEGNAPFGYGNGDEATVLSDMRGNYERVYLSKAFQLRRIPSGAELKLIIRYNDAFVAWLNGTEIARSHNISSHHYREAEVHERHEPGETGEVFVIEEAHDILIEGQNLLSVAGHNHRKRRARFTIDPVLTLGGREIVPHGATWKYLAGSDPPSRWFLQDPRTSPVEEAPREDEANWAVGLRRRGAGTSFVEAKIEERDLGESPDRVFESVVEGLRPDTAYEYFLEARGERVHRGWFRTAPRTLDRPLVYVTGGDMGTTTGIPICRRAGREDPLFGLLGGDLAYGNGRLAYKWHDWMDNWSEFAVGEGGREIPLIAGIGNHEMKSQLTFLSLLERRYKKAPYYFTLFDLPGGDSNFTVDFGNYMSIVMLDSNHAQKIAPQTLWLGGQLQERRERPHLFAVYHRPAWGTGVKKNSRKVQKLWCPLFEKYGVDCAFENDHHVYKRSRKIVGGVPDEENGVLYLGDGAWGAGLRPITERDLARVGARKYLAEWKAERHLIKVTIFPDGRKRYQAMTSNGTVFDEFEDRGTPPTE